MKLDIEFLINAYGDMLLYEEQFAFMQRNMIKPGESFLEKQNNAISVYTEMVEIYADLDVRPPASIRTKANKLHVKKFGRTIKETAMVSLGVNEEMYEKDDTIVVIQPQDPEVLSKTDRLLSDFVFFCKTCCEILYRPGLNKDFPKGGVGPLIPQSAQLAVIAEIADRFFADEIVRVVCLKSRQMGITTILLAFWVWLACTIPGFTVFILIDKDAHLIKKVGAMKKWIKNAHKEDPTVFPDIDSLPSKAIVLTNGSMIMFDSAESRNPGTSEMIRAGHYSEEPKWPKGRTEQVDASITPAIPEMPGTILVNESTAEGVGNGFFRRIDRINKGLDTETLFLFIPWFISDEYCLKPTDNDYDELGNFIYKNENKELAILDSEGKIKLTEQEYAELYSLRDDQICWRRRKIINAFKGDQWKFNQEYPTDKKDAWLAAMGGNFLSPGLIRSMRDHEREPVFVGEVIDADDRLNDETQVRPYTDYSPVLVHDGHGPLRIFEMPQQEKTYYIGADFAEGKSAKLSERDPDYDSTWFVVTDEDGKVCALWTLQEIKPEAAWLPLLLLALFYMSARINGELNGPGATTWALFKLSGYWSNHIREGLGPSIDRAWSRVPNSVTGRNKLLLDLKILLIKSPEFVVCKELIKQFEMLYRSPKTGRIEARTGEHDDGPFAYAHLWTMLFRQVIKAKTIIEPTPEKINEDQIITFGELMFRNNIKRY